MAGKNGATLRIGIGEIERRNQEDLTGQVDGRRKSDNNETASRVKTYGKKRRRYCTSLS